MAERRQAHRREPIEVEIQDEVVTARPRPWLERNDIGNEIMRQYAELLNSSIQAYKNPGTDTPQLSLYLNDKIKDPVAVVVMGYPELEERVDWLNSLDYDELLELVYATLEVNRLETLRELVDPNYQTPMRNGGTSSSGTEEGMTDTQSQPSSPDSSSQESPEEKSSN